jgi:hypothetical protein
VQAVVPDKPIVWIVVPYNIDGRKRSRAEIQALPVAQGRFHDASLAQG